MAIDTKPTKLIVNPGGTNFKFIKDSIRHAQVILHEDNNTIFETIINRKADLMITDSVEVHYQVKKHPGVLCATMKTPITKGKIAYLIPRDLIWKDYVNAWLESN